MARDEQAVASIQIAERATKAAERSARWAMIAAIISLLGVIISAAVSLYKG